MVLILKSETAPGTVCVYWSWGWHHRYNYITRVDKTLASYKIFHEMGLSFRVQYYFWERLLGQRGVDKYQLLFETLPYIFNNLKDNTVAINKS